MKKRKIMWWRKRIEKKGQTEEQIMDRGNVSSGFREENVCVFQVLLSEGWEG